MSSCTTLIWRQRTRTERPVDRSAVRPSAERGLAGRTRWALRCLLALVGLTGGAPAQALQPPVREAEIASCQPGEQAHWADGRDRPAAAGPLRLAYRHAGAPPWFSAAQVLAVVQRAAVAWAACGVPVQVLPLLPGLPTGSPSQTGEARPDAPGDGAVLVQWNEPGSAGNFGLAHLGQRTLSLGRGAFELLRQRNPAYPAADVLQMVVSHEMGHFFGLMAHSRRCVDVMSYYHDAQGRQCFTRDGQDHRRVPEYRALLPTACDIQRCRAVNGQPPAP